MGTDVEAKIVADVEDSTVAEALELLRAVRDLGVERREYDLESPHSRRLVHSDCPPGPPAPES